MMIGEPNHHHHHPTIQIPSWTPPHDDPTAGMYLNEAFSALQQYLPSNDVDSDGEINGCDVPVDVYSCDNFRMFEFKVRRCARGRSHDWTECPYAHPGEKARRRDPRKFHYSGTACAEFRKGNCRKGDSCEFAHGVFECWLHPARYRTQPCKDGTNCRRRVCFFAHTPEQLRVLPQSSQGNSPELYDGSPLRQVLDAAAVTRSPSVSPPMSPMTATTPVFSRSVGSVSVDEMVASFRQLQLSRSFGTSPRMSVLRNGFCSLPSTPTGKPTRVGYLDFGERGVEEEPVMERVESGKDLRAKMFDKLRRENSLGKVEPSPAVNSSGPDVDWVSELVM
ncbi:Zinc finger, CCCH-type [Dillenia turbinata]|uniref:Zinc finger, CCCH-type n=1 Tax=Dillenia turbinata TaxID=194707 RepID=A0AAN8ZTN8_9MAGN